MIVQPATEYPDNERNTIQSYVETGGHAVVAGEPTQTRVGGGLFATIAQVPFGATELAESYGINIGAEALYNVDDEANDTRRADTYPVVARNDSVVFVADGSFLSQPELYDADNEVFTSNLVEFLLRGDPGGGFR